MSQTVCHPQAISLDDMQHFVMEDANWDLYEKLLRDIGDRPIRVTYDDGRMEIMSPLPEHERPKTLIGRKATWTGVVKNLGGPAPTAMKPGAIQPARAAPVSFPMAS